MKPLSPTERDYRQQEAFHRLTDILRCKWTLAILDALTQGINRPVQIVRALPGLTTKVLYERVHKLERYGLVIRHSYPEIPPRVEYELTDRGRRLVALIRQMKAFAQEWVEEAEEAPTPHANGAQVDEVIP
ncbi:MAG: helix-turn-helix domain-containing protein [Armatimonadota bacterium]